MITAEQVFCAIESRLDFQAICSIADELGLPDSHCEQCNVDTPHLETDEYNFCVLCGHIDYHKTE